MGAPPEPTSLARPWLSSYPPGVPPTYRFPSVPVVRFLDDAARDFPEHTALVVAGQRLDHEALRVRVDTVATALRRHGISSGDRVLIALANGAALPVVLLALWRLGAVVVPVDPTDRPARLAAVAEDAQVAAVVATAEVLDHLADRALLPGLTVQVTGGEWPAAGRVRRTAARLAAVRPRRRTGTGAEPHLRLAEMLPDAELRDLPPPPTPDLPAMLAYRPRSRELRGVVLDHRNLVASAFQARLWVPDIQAGREVVLLADGLHQAAVLVLGWLAALLAGATVVVLDDPDPVTLARAVEREQPTLLVTAPRRIAQLLAEGDAARRDLTSLRVVLTVGAALDPRVAQDLEGRSRGARVRELFGLAEAGGLTHGQPVYGRAALGAAGLPVTSTVGAVVDPADHAVLVPPGTAGRLLVHGPQVATGYWRRPEASAERFVDGWLVTDDIAVVDEEGVFTHLGRQGEVVERQDQVVSLRRLEAVLERHPSVRRAGAVASEDGLVLVAAVTLRRRPRVGPEELVDHVAGLVEPAAVPDRVVVLERLPDDDLGELDRDGLRRELIGR